MGSNPKYAERLILPSQAGRVGVTVTPFVPRAQQPWSANDATNATNAKHDVTSAAEVGTAGRAAANNAAAEDANDGTEATNATRDATYDRAYAIGKHDDAAASIRRAESVRTDLLTGRGGFHSK